MKIRVQNPFPIELIVLASLLAWNGAGWFLAQSGTFGPRLSVLVVGLADAVVIPIFSLWVLQSRPSRFGPWHIYAAMTSASFGVYGLSGVAELDDPTWVGYVLAALGIVKFGLASMWIGSSLAARSGHSMRDTVRSVGAWIAGPGMRVAWLIVAIRWIIQSVTFSQGIVISGTSGHMGELGPIATVLVMLNPIAQVASLITVVLVLAFAGPGKRRIWVAILGIEALGIALLTGRRVMLALLLVAMVIWRMSRESRKVSYRTMIASAVLLSVLIGVAWPFFYYMRTYAFTQEVQLGDVATADRLTIFVTEVLPGAIETFSLSESYFGDSDYATNVTSRATVTGYLALVVEAESEGAQQMLGRIFVSIVEANIPRLIWAEKQVEDPEEMVNMHFGLPLVDSPSTFATQAYAELGLLGVAIYLAAFGGFLSFTLSRLGNTRFLFTRLFVLAVLLTASTEVEVDLTSMISHMRWWIIAITLDSFFRLLSPKVPSGPVDRPVA